MRKLFLLLALGAFGTMQAQRVTYDQAVVYSTTTGSDNSGGYGNGRGNHGGGYGNSGYGRGNHGGGYGNSGYGRGNHGGYGNSDYGRGNHGNGYGNSGYGRGNHGGGYAYTSHRR